MKKRRYPKYRKLRDPNARKCYGKVYSPKVVNEQLEGRG